jgi:hypothetical protein
MNFSKPASGSSWQARRSTAAASPRGPHSAKKAPYPSRNSAFCSRAAGRRQALRYVTSAPARRLLAQAATLRSAAPREAGARLAHLGLQVQGSLEGGARRGEVVCKVGHLRLQKVVLRRELRRGEQRAQTSGGGGMRWTVGCERKESSARIAVLGSRKDVKFVSVYRGYADRDGRSEGVRRRGAWAACAGGAIDARLACLGAAGLDGFLPLAVFFTGTPISTAGEEQMAKAGPRRRPLAAGLRRAAGDGRRGGNTRAGASAAGSAGPALKREASPHLTPAKNEKTRRLHT